MVTGLGRFQGSIAADRTLAYQDTLTEGLTEFIAGDTLAASAGGVALFIHAAGDGSPFDTLAIHTILCPVTEVVVKALAGIGTSTKISYRDTLLLGCTEELS